MNMLLQENGKTDGFLMSSITTKALKIAAQFWFVVALVGQLIFVVYILRFYGGAVLNDNLAEWNKVLPFGYVAGDSTGNLIVGAHILSAFLIMIAGAVQLIPQVRTRAPVFHRWNGRIYLLFALLASVAGLYMNATRGGGTAEHPGITLNAILIAIFAALTLRYAVSRNFAIHRRWALRLFLTVCGVWFFRVGLMFWIFINSGPVGFDMETFKGPALTILSFAQYLLPLAVLELYLLTQDHGGPKTKVVMAVSIVVLTIAMGIGIFVATLGLWIPHM